MTSAPCLECAKLIIQAGVVRVVYSDFYRTSTGLELLRQAGIEIMQLHLEAGDVPCDCGDV